MGQLANNPANNAPIGVFDSGLGGLTVLREIISELPQESTIYLGDTARVPYGIRSPEVVTKYSFENMRFLLSKGIKMLVIACNTASAISLEALKRESPVPVIGVIRPGAKAALKATRNGRIGVTGTETTIKSGAYARVLESLSPGVKVFSKACPLFVPLVEEGWVDNEVALLTAKNYLSGLAGDGIDTILLGCTHYPLLKKTIAAVMGESVTLIDSAKETAVEIRKLLEEKDFLRNASLGPEREFFVTDAPERFKKLGGRFLPGEDTAKTKKAGGQAIIQEVKLMEVWNEFSTGWQKK
ncbi:MAG: glutamate racemase [Nitrospiraceae bacterium]|nr:glutamate racemase [Nitrospiraceae bacterium]